MKSSFVEHVALPLARDLALPGIAVRSGAPGDDDGWYLDRDGLLKVERGQDLKNVRRLPTFGT